MADETENQVDPYRRLADAEARIIAPILSVEDGLICSPFGRCTRDDSREWFRATVFRCRGGIPPVTVVEIVIAEEIAVSDNFDAEITEAAKQALAGWRKLKEEGKS